MAKDST